MASIQIVRFGADDPFEFTHETGEDRPAPDQILVRVEAASVNPIDPLLAAGLFGGDKMQGPRTAGGDFVGTVVELGRDVLGFRVGDRVFGQAGLLFGGSGSFSTFALAPARYTARVPEEVTDEQAAALPLAGASALQAIEKLSLGEGDSVLVVGGAGAIGSLAVQLAAARGARVVATSRPEDADYVRSLGATDVLDHAQTEWTERAKDFDALLDASSVRLPRWRALLATLRRGGRAIFLSSKPDQADAEQAGVSAAILAAQPTTQRLDELARWAAQGRLAVRVGEVYDIEDGVEALAAKPRGKVVITL